MSVLQELEQIRREIGEERYNQIDQFLKANQQYDLSDVYYKEEVWKESEEWMRNNGIEPAVNPKQSEYSYLDIEALEGGSPADVGLDARLDETEITADERKELEALRAFKSYFDDCMVGQGYDIANFHMNGELEPFDNFYDTAMMEYDKAYEKSDKELSFIVNGMPIEEYRDVVALQIGYDDYEDMRNHNVSIGDGYDTINIEDFLERKKVLTNSYDDAPNKFVLFESESEMTNEIAARRLSIPLIELVTDKGTVDYIVEVSENNDTSLSVWTARSEDYEPVYLSSDEKAQLLDAVLKDEMLHHGEKVQEINSKLALDYSQGIVDRNEEFTTMKLFWGEMLETNFEEETNKIDKRNPELVKTVNKLLNNQADVTFDATVQMNNVTNDVQLFLQVSNAYTFEVPLADTEKEILRQKFNEYQQYCKDVQIDFTNCVDEKSEIMTDNGKVDVILFLSDSKYEQLLERTDVLKNENVTFDYLLRETDATVDIYADVYPDGNVVLTAVLSGGMDYQDVEIPISDEEKESIKKDIDRAGEIQYGKFLSELIQEAVEYAEETPKPEKKDKSNKKRDDLEL